MRKEAKLFRNLTNIFQRGRTFSSIMRFIEWVGLGGAHTQYTIVNATRTSMKKSAVRPKLKLTARRLPRIGPMQKPRGRDNMLRRESRSDKLGASL